MAFIQLWYYYSILVFTTVLFNNILANTYSFISANTGLPYFQAKRENLKNYAVEPKFLEDNKILFISPLQKSLPNFMMPIHEKHYKNLKQEYVLSNSIPYNSKSVQKLLQQLFRMPKLHKIWVQSFQNSVEKNVKSRNKRLHGLSLLRKYKGKFPMFMLNKQIVNETALKDRQKRLHSLPRLRGYSNKPKNEQLENVLNRPKCLYNCKLLFPLHSYNIKTNNLYLKNKNKKQTLSKPKRLHSLSLLRGYKNKVKNLFSQYKNSKKNSKILSRPKRLHNLAFLHSYNGKLKMPLFFTNNVDLNTYRQQIRKRNKRIHNLSLLRYNGKLFQNLLGSQVTPDLLSDLQQKRFEKMYLLSRLQFKFKALNQPTYHYLY